MRFIGLIFATGLALSACDSPPPQPQQDNLVNATRTDQAFPSGVDGNDVITGGDETTTPVGSQQGAQQGQQQGPPPQ